MKRKRHNPEQIIRKLRSAEQLLNQGQTVAWSSPDLVDRSQSFTGTIVGDAARHCS
jgi:hypothetical protein